MRKFKLEMFVGHPLSGTGQPCEIVKFNTQAEVDAYVKAQFEAQDSNIDWALLTCPNGNTGEYYNTNLVV